MLAPGSSFVVFPFRGGGLRGRTGSSCGYCAEECPEGKSARHRYDLFSSRSGLRCALLEGPEHTAARVATALASALVALQRLDAEYLFLSVATLALDLDWPQRDRHGQQADCCQDGLR